MAYSCEKDAYLLLGAFLSGKSLNQLFRILVWFIHQNLFLNVVPRAIHLPTLILLSVLPKEHQIR